MGHTVDTATVLPFLLAVGHEVAGGWEQRRWQDLQGSTVPSHLQHNIQLVPYHSKARSREGPDGTKHPTTGRRACEEPASPTLVGMGITRGLHELSERSISPSAHPSLVLSEGGIDR